MDSLLFHDVPQLILRGLFFLGWDPKTPTCIAVITSYHKLAPSICITFTTNPHGSLLSGLLQNRYVNAKMKLLIFILVWHIYVQISESNIDSTAQPQVISHLVAVFLF